MNGREGGREGERDRRGGRMRGESISHRRFTPGEFGHLLRSNR